MFLLGITPKSPNNKMGDKQVDIGTRKSGGIEENESETLNLEHTVSPDENLTMKNETEIFEHPVENDVETVDDVNSYDVSPGCVCVIVRRTCTIHGVKAKMIKTKKCVWTKIKRTGLYGSRTTTSVSWTCPLQNNLEASNSDKSDYHNLMGQRTRGQGQLRGEYFSESGD